MDTQPARPDVSVRVLNPLWIISLFLGLAEVTVGIATTQADGWVQGLLAIFAVAFPTSVAGVFFWILWQRPLVLYAPKDYAEEPGIKDFAEALASSTDRSVENVDTAIRAAFEQVIVPRLTVLDDEKQRRRVVEEAVATARRDIQLRTIEVDLGGIHASLARDPLLFPVAESTTVSELLDAVYLAIAGYVDAYTYDQRWVLRDAETGRDYRQMGRAWARATLGQTRDRRRLAEAGIEPGTRLHAVWLDRTHHRR